MKRKLIDAEAWLAQCNQSWMNYNLAKHIIAKAPCYEVEEELLTPCEGSERATVPMDDANKATRPASSTEFENSVQVAKPSFDTSSTASGPPSPIGEGGKKPNTCKCRSCGAEIVFVTMRSGAKMPCDAELIHAVADDKAKTSFVLPGGIIKRGTVGTFASAAGGRESEQKGVAAVAEGEGAEATDARCGNGNRDRRPDGMADFVGYRSHFETCPKAGEFRKRGKDNG